MEIRSEYWIEDGSITDADGDAGDVNHEGHAIQHVVYQYATNVANLAEEFDIEADINLNEPDPQSVKNVLYEIYEALQAQGNTEPDRFIAQKLRINPEGLSVLFHENNANASLYVMKYDGWIAVRGMNIDVYGYNEQKRKSLVNGLNDIFEQEGFDFDEIEPENIEFWLFDFKNEQSRNVTLEDLENPAPKPRPAQVPTSKGDRRFIVTSPDTQENIPQKTPDGKFIKPQSFPSKDTEIAKKAKMIGPGQDFWRGTSESFKSWLKTIEN